jgi:hypothetical protein
MRALETNEMRHSHFSRDVETLFTAAPRYQEDLESGLERLLECSFQRLLKLEEIRPRRVFESSERLGLV